MVSTTRKEDVDIFGLARDSDQACVQVFFVRGMQMIGRAWNSTWGERPDSDILTLRPLPRETLSAMFHRLQRVLRQHRAVIVKQDFFGSLAGYTGAAVDAHTELDSDAANPSVISFAATAGASYAIAVDSATAAQGDIELRVVVDGGNQARGRRQ